jgi:uncharacterized membrane protein YdfJ with MMPL/SSD domain
VFLSTLARVAVRHTRLLLATALALVIVGGIFGPALANRLSPSGLEDPASESTRANALITKATGNESAPGVIVLAALGKSIKSVSEENTKAVLEQLALALRIHKIERVIKADPEVGKVRSALDDGFRFVSRNGRLTYLTVQFRAGSERHYVEAAQRLAKRLRGVPAIELSGVDYGAWQADNLLNESARHAEQLAFPILFLLLLWFFRGLIAAMLPLMIGGTAIILTQAGLGLAGYLLPISSLVVGVLTALGIGLSIDYSLLIVSRFREELALSANVPQALERTLRTAGRTVLFSSVTVAAALASLLTLPQRLIYSMGLGGMLVALLAGIATLTLLPAMLALLGPRINALSPRRLQRSAQTMARPQRSGPWYRLAMMVMRRPVVVAVCAGALLLSLGAPALGMKFTMPGVSTMPTSTSSRQVSDILSSDFKIDPNRTIEIVTVGARSRQLTAYRHTLGELGGVSSIVPVQHLNSQTAMYYLTSTHVASSAAAQQLVKHIRSLSTPFETKVTGPTATYIDLKSSLLSHIPIALIWIAVATLLSIFLLTGSVVLPPKTLLMNALVAVATLGIVVLIFQDGYLQDLLGYSSPGTIEITQPLFIVTILFGLSTDYGVFLIDRIREARDKGAGNEEAIALGLERTGRITTTAALLLCVAIGSLITSPISASREISFGVSAAVLLDAVVVRTLLVPALMRLLGEANWWCPAPLRRFYRHASQDTSVIAGADPSSAPTDATDGTRSPDSHPAMAVGLAHRGALEDRDG